MKTYIKLADSLMVLIKASDRRDNIRATLSRPHIAHWVTPEQIKEADEAYDRAACEFENALSLSMD